METINLTIPNMKSSHCQMTVTGAVKAIGANVKSVAPTKAEIELAAGVTKDAVIQAIQKAGYNVVNGTI
jgi:copper chaperone CopZ